MNSLDKWYEMQEELNQEKIVQKTDTLQIGDDLLSAYYVMVDNETTVVMAKNLADACGKLDKLGVLEYKFVHHRSVEIIY